MKNLFKYIFFLLIFSCKKENKNNDIAIQQDSDLATTTTTTTTTYNIVYKDWIPDSTFILINPNNIDTITSMLIDLDSNNVFDLKLQIKQHSAQGGPSTGIYYVTYFSVIPLNSNVVVSARSQITQNNIAVTDTVNHKLSWTNSELLLKCTHPYWGMGAWDLGVLNNGYIATKLISPIGIKYGWIYIDIPFYSSFIIKSQAINHTTNQPLLVGQIQ